MVVESRSALRVASTSVMMGSYNAAFSPLHKTRLCCCFIGVKNTVVHDRFFTTAANCLDAFPSYS